jgi:hypothetical protein
MLLFREGAPVKSIATLQYVLVSALAVAPIAVAACSSDDDDESGHEHEGHDDHHGGDSGDPYADLPPICVSIIDACHTKDPGLPGEVNTCHTFGHEGIEADCQSAVDDGCLDTCNDAPTVEE